MRLCESLQLSLGGVVGRFKRAEQHRAVHIHPGNLEHQRRGLHPAVRFPSFMIGNTGMIRHVSIPGPVHEYARLIYLSAALRFRDDPDNPVSLHHGTADEGVEQNVHVCVTEHVEIDRLELLRIDVFREPTMARALIPVCHVCEQLRIQPAADTAGEMAHQSGRGYAADTVVPFDQQDARAQSAGRDRR